MSSRLLYVSFSSLLSGSTVKIVWGVDQRTAIVPEALLRSCRSASLDASLKEVWINNENGTINWKEQDGATIERFLTWLYRGDYNAPDPQPLCPSSSYQGKGDQEDDKSDTVVEGTPDAVPASELAEPQLEHALEPAPEPVPESELELTPEPERDVLQETEQGDHSHEWPQVDSHAIQHVIAASYDTRPLTPINSCLIVGLPEKYQTSEAGKFAQDLFPYKNHHYKEVLLAHARLYTFALYKDIKGLQDLSLQRLTQILTQIDCRQPHAASEIAVLIQHVYCETLPPDYSKDAARKLVSQFAAINFDELVHGEFEILLEKGGDFVLDISRKVSRHLRSARNCALATEEHTRELESEVQTLKKEAQKRIDGLFQHTPSWAVGSGTKKKTHR